MMPVLQLGEPLVLKRFKRVRDNALPCVEAGRRDSAIPPYRGIGHSDTPLTRRTARLHHVPKGNDLTVCEVMLRE